MLCIRFAAGRTGALHKINGIFRKENYMSYISQEVEAWSKTGLGVGVAMKNEEFMGRLKKEV